MSDTNEKAPPPQEPTNEKPPAEAPAPDAEPVKRKREYKDFGHEEEKATRKFYSQSHPPLEGLTRSLPSRREG